MLRRRHTNNVEPKRDGLAVALQDLREQPFALVLGLVFGGLSHYYSTAFFLVGQGSRKARFF